MKLDSFEDEKRIGKQRRTTPDEFAIEIHNGRISIRDHVFVHDAKLSAIMLDQLRRNGLVIEDVEALAGERFVVVRKDASDLILAGLATRVANRLGLDAITDKPLAFSANVLRDIEMVPSEACVHGALLSSLARVTIPAAIRTLTTDEFVSLRDSYAGIRESFKHLTLELSRLNRLTRITDPKEFACRIEDVANDFNREFLSYRRSKYARAFKTWLPFCVGSAMAIATGVSVSDRTGVLLETGVVAMELARRHLHVEPSSHNRVFQLLTSMREDLLRQSKLSKLVTG